MEVKVMVGVPVMPLSVYRLKGFKFDLQRFSEPDGNWSDYAASSFSTIDESAHTITINSAAELALLAKNVNNETNSYSGWTITLGNNIDLGEYYWTPIGGEGYGNAFKGTFDGNGKTVSNVNVQDTIGIGTSGYCFGGFFGYVFGGTIKNLNLNTVGVSSTRGGYIGGLVGNGTNSTIDNCFLYNVTLSGGNYSGGLAGEALRSNITNCFAQSTGGRSGFVDSATRFNNGIDNPNIFYASDSNDSYAKKLFSTSMLPAGVTATYTGNNYYTVTLGGNTFYQTGATFKLSYDGTVPEGYYGVDGLKAYGQPLTKNADGTYTFTVNLENTYKGRAIEYQAQPAITGFPYDSATKTYTISSKDDLKRLSDHVKEGGNTSGLTFKLMADIDDVDFQIGDKTGNSFKGIFDGNGHKITVNISKDNNAALFYRVENGTIKDLTLEGNITAQNQYVAAASSFIDTSGGNVSILNCTSNVSIKSYNSMDSYSGGFVSYNRSGTLNLKNCTFGGKLDVGGYSGGFVGLNESITNVDSCIFMPEAASFNGNSNCATFVQNRRLVAGGNEGFATVKNSYHTQTFGDNPNGSTEIRSQVTEGFTRSSIINGVTVYFASQGLEALVGDGTAENPYQLNVQSSLNKLAEHIRTGGSTAGLHFILTNNFSYGGSIGNTSNPFQGTLDGNGKTLTATGSALFGAIKDATVKNLAISGSISDTAALSNSTAGNVSLDNVYCNSTVSAKNFYGLLGSVDDGATLNFNNVFLRIGTSGRVNLHSPVGSKAGSVSVNGNVYYAYCDFSSADGIKVIEVDIPGGVDVTCNDADKFVRDSTTYYKIGAELNLNADMTKYEFADIPQAVSAGSGKFTYTVAEQNQLSFESYPKINGITFDADSKTYTISNAAELNALAAYVNAGNTCAGYNFKVTADINMSGESFKPIGTEGNSFRGNFDGNGLTISGLTSGDYNYVGLFGENYGTIQNVNLDNVNFNVGTCVGAIAAHNSGSIKNCSASGYVNGMNWVGGLVAENDGGYVQNSFSNVKADSGSSLVGNNQGIVSGCSYVENGAFDSTGSTKLCTLNLPKGIEITCDASKMKVFNGVAYYVPNTEVTLTLTDDFKASYKNSSVGLKGLTQNADGTYKLTVANNVTVEAQGEEVVKGLLFSTADNAFIIETAADLQALANYVNGGGNTLGYNFKVTADIDLKGINFTSIGVGGTTNRFKGNFDGDNHVISNLYVNGNDYVGLFGENYGTIQNVYLLNANVSGNEYVGGLVGYNFRSIQNCFVEGKISGGDTVGAIVGVNIDTVQDCYYHSDADGVGEKVLLLNLPEGVTAQISGETLNVGGKTFCKQGTTVTLDASELKQKYYTLKLSAGDTVATDNGDNTCTLTLDTVDTITAGGLLKIDGLNRFEDGNVLIGSRDELKALADYVENGNDCAGYNFKLDQNISGVDFQIGTADTPFRGTLDGDNHSISATNTLFDYIDNATFKNLTIDGEFSGATFALHSTGSCDFVNCAFIGSLTGEDSCGFVKYNSGNVKVDNCVFAPTSLAVSGGGFTFAENANVTDSYYTQPLDTAQGEQVFSELNLPAGVTAEVINGDTLSIGGNNFYKPGTVFKLTSTLSKTNPYMFKAGNTVSGFGTGGVYQIALGSSNNVEVLDLPDLDGAAYSYDDNSYTLTTNEQIQALASAVNSGFDFKGITIKLANDLSNVDCTVGTVDNPFRGTLDGQGNTLTTSKTLFGYVDGATIKDLSIDGNISGNSYTGGLINCAAGNVSISNVNVNADVSVTSGNTQVVGGIIGNAQDSAVNFTNVNFYGTLTNNQNYAGGFVGWSQGGASLNFDNCFNMGSYVGKGNYYPVAVREQNANVTITDKDLYFSEPATFDDNSYAAGGGSFLYESLRLPAGVTAELVSGDKKTVNGKDYYQSGAVWNITIEDGSVIDEHQLLKAGTATALNIGNDQYQITITNSATLNVADSFEPFGDMTFDYSRNAYLIKTADDLNYLSQAVNGRNNCAGKTFILANDIDMRGVNFTPIGNAQVNYDFAGTFDGNGYTISNLTISDGVNVGLFGYNRGTIRNLNLLNANIQGKSASGLVYLNHGTVENCTVTGSVSGINYTAGGVVGINNGTVTNCVSDVKVSGRENYAYAVIGANTMQRNNFYVQGYDKAASKIYKLSGIPSGVEVAAPLNDTFQVNGKIYCKDGTTLTLTVPDNVSGWYEIGGFRDGNNRQVELSNGSAEFTISGTGKLSAYGAQVLSGVAYDSATKTYTIDNSDDFYWLEKAIENGNSFEGCTFKLANDIYMNSTMLGTSETPFAGTIDGNGKTLKLFVAFNTDNAAFIQYGHNATIKNLNLTGGIYSVGNNIASLIAVASGNSTIENCTVDYEIQNSNTHAGLVGTNKGTLTIKDTTYKGNLHAANNDNVGGFVAVNSGHVDISGSSFTPLYTEFGSGAATFVKGGSFSVKDSYTICAVGGDTQGAFLCYQVDDLNLPEGITATHKSGSKIEVTRNEWVYGKNGIYGKYVDVPYTYYKDDATFTLVTDTGRYTAKYAAIKVLGVENNEFKPTADNKTIQFLSKPKINGVNYVGDYDSGYYQIGSAAAWQSLYLYIQRGGNTTGLTFKLTADISDAELDMLRKFNGTLDGNGHKFKNIKLSNGLIGTNSGTVQNVTIEGGSLNTSLTSEIGGLINDNKGTVESCTVDGMNITASGNCVGGLIGTNSGKVNNSASVGNTITAKSYGGLIGTNSGTVTNSFTNVNATTGNNPFILTNSGTAGADNGYYSTETATTNAVKYAVKLTMPAGVTVQSGGKVVGNTVYAKRGEELKFATDGEKLSINHTNLTRGDDTYFSYKAADSGEYELSVTGVTVEDDGSTFDVTKGGFIRTKADLLALMNHVIGTSAQNGGHLNDCAGLTYTLAADIDMAGEDWTPLGKSAGAASSVMFKGTINGNGHKISNMTQPLIVINAGTVKDLTLENVAIGSGSQGGAGAVVGLFNYGTVQNVKVTGYVKGSDNDNVVGGIVCANSNFYSDGKRIDGIVEDCTFVGYVSSDYRYLKYVGAIVGTTANNNVSGNRFYVDYSSQYVEKDGKTELLPGTITDEPPAIGNIPNNGSIAPLKDNKAYNSSFTLPANVKVSGDCTIIGSTVYTFKGTELTMQLPEGYGLGTLKINGTQLTGKKFTVPEGAITFGGSIENNWGMGGVADEDQPEVINEFADGSQEHPFIINTFADLKKLADNVNGGNDYAGVYFKLGKDITAPENIKVGNWNMSRSRYFKGIFDGNGHKITLNSNTSDYHYGLFGALNGATIKNLTVDGSINTSKTYTGGLVGCVDGSNATTIENCKVEVTINATHDGNNNHGGIVGDNYGTLNIKDTSFTGSLTGSGTSWRGFVGNPAGTINISNSIFAPASVTVSENRGFTFTETIYGANLDNCYYTRALGKAQGSQFCDLKLPEGFTFTGGTGVNILGKTYYRAGDTVILSGTLANGKMLTSGNEFASPNADGTFTLKLDGDIVLKDAPTIEGLTFSNGAYQITSAADLQTLATYTNAGNNCAGLLFKVANDIDMSTVENFTPIAYYNNNGRVSFAGVFDGGGHVISNLTISGNYYVGLFGGVTGGGTVKNVNLVNANVSGNSEVGGITGQNYGKVENCFVEGTIRGSSNVGAVVCNFKGTVSDCYYCSDTAGDWTSTRFYKAPSGNFTATYTGEDALKYTVGDNTYYRQGATFKIEYDASKYTDFFGITSTTGTIEQSGGEYIYTIENGSEVEINGALALEDLEYSDRVYTLNSQADFDKFVAYVNAGNTFANCTVKLAADVNLTSAIGDYNDRRFKGTFDGGNHFITASGYVFDTTENATIKNLGYSGISLVTHAVNSLKLRNILADNENYKIVPDARSYLVDSKGIYRMQNAADYDKVKNAQKVYKLDLPEGVTARTINGDSVTFGGKTYYDEYAVVELTVDENTRNAAQVKSLKFNGKGLEYDFETGKGRLIVDGNGAITLESFAKINGLRTDATHNYYLINSAEDWNLLQAFNGDTSGLRFKLTADIETSTAISNFKGTFDGGNHKITATATPFGTIDGAIIKNLTVDGASVADNATGSTIIRNVQSLSADYVIGTNSGTLTAANSAGNNFVNSNNGTATIKNSLSTSGDFGGTVENCYTTADNVPSGATRVYTAIPAGLKLASDNPDVLTYFGTKYLPQGATINFVSDGNGYHGFKVGENSYSGKDIYAATNYAGDVDGLLVYPRIGNLKFSDGNYEIRSANDWKTLADYVAMGNTCAGLTFKLTKDIKINAAIANEFSGIFNGDGHKITTSATPFSNVSNGTIENLTVDGSISGASFITEASNVNVNNCAFIGTAASGFIGTGTATFSECYYTTGAAVDGATKIYTLSGLPAQLELTCAAGGTVEFDGKTYYKSGASLTFSTAEERRILDSIALGGVVFTKNDGANTYTGTLSGDAANLEFAGRWHIQLKDGGDTYLNTEDSISILGGNGNDSIENDAFSVTIDTAQGDDTIKLHSCDYVKLDGFDVGDVIEFAGKIDSLGTEGVDENKKTVIISDYVYTTLQGVNFSAEGIHWNFDEETHVGTYAKQVDEGVYLQDDGKIGYRIYQQQGETLVQLSGVASQFNIWDSDAGNGFGIENGKKFFALNPEHFLDGGDGITIDSNAGDFPFVFNFSSNDAPKKLTLSGDGDYVHVTSNNMTIVGGAGKDTIHLYPSVTEINLPNFGRDDVLYLGGMISSVEALGNDSMVAHWYGGYVGDRAVTIGGITEVAKNLSGWQDSGDGKRAYYRASAGGFGADSNSQYITYIEENKAKPIIELSGMTGEPLYESGNGFNQIELKPEHFDDGNRIEITQQLGGSQIRTDYGTYTGKTLVGSEGDYVAYDADGNVSTIYDEFNGKSLEEYGDVIENNGENIVIQGRSGKDSITNYGGGDGATIDGGTGDDIIINQGDNVSIDGGAGNDIVKLDSSCEGVTVKTAQGNDTIFSTVGEFTVEDFKTGDVINVGGGEKNISISDGKLVVSDGYNTYKVTGISSIAENVTRTWTNSGDVWTCGLSVDNGEGAYLDDNGNIAYAENKSLFTLNNLRGDLTEEEISAGVRIEGSTVIVSAQILDTSKNLTIQSLNADNIYDLKVDEVDQYRTVEAGWNELADSKIGMKASYFDEAGTVSGWLKKSDGTWQYQRGTIDEPLLVLDGIIFVQDGELYKTTTDTANKIITFNDYALDANKGTFLDVLRNAGGYIFQFGDNTPDTYSCEGMGKISGVTFGADADGNAYYRITDAADLQAFSDYVNGGGNTAGITAKLFADIDMSSVANFTPIAGNASNPFKGTFDGDNHYIRNLTINGTGAAGLFGYVNGGTIQKVKLSNANITGNDAGGIVAHNEGGTVKNCFVDGTINGDGEVGAIVGLNDGGTYSGNYYHSNATNGSIPKRSRKAAENDFTRVYELGELPAGVTAEFVGNEEEYTFTVEIDGEVKTYYKAGATFTLTLDSSKFSDCEKVTLNNCTLNEDGTYTYTIPENFAETDIVFTTFEFPKIDGLEFVDDGTGGYYKLNSMSDIAAMLTVDRKDLTFTLANDKFNITSEDELNALADFVNNGGDTSGITFTLTKDLDFTDKTFKPIGDAANPFKGTFNGNGKTIINCAANSASVGLFGVNSGTITDVVLADCTFGSVAEDGVVGSIVGNNSGTVKNSFFAGGTLTGYNVGAIAGVNSGTLTDNYYYGDYSGNGTRVYKLTLPEGVTASGEHLTEYGGEYYAPAGEQISFTIGDDADTSAFVKVTGLNNVSLDYSMPAQDVDNLNITGYPKIDGLEFDATGNYYKIQNYTDLQALATYVNAGNICEGLTFKQTKDIDMSSVENFTPINNLAGTFDGQGNVISNLTITKGGYEDKAALFGINRGTIQNVKLLNANISAYSCVAGIAVENYGTIENCFVDGTIHDTCGSNQFKAVVYKNDMMSDPTNPEVLPVEPKVENCYYHVDAPDDYATKVYELTINPHFTISDASNAFVIGGKVFGAGEVSFKLTADDSRRVIDGSDTYSANISADTTVTTNYHIQLDDGGESFTVDSDGAISVLGGNGDDTITNYNDDITIAGGAGNNVINLRGGTGTVIDTDGGDDLINVLGVESFRVQGFGVGDSIAGVATEIETVAGGIKAGDVTINGLSKGDRYNKWQIADSVGKYVPVSVEGAFVDDGAIIYQDAAQGSALVELNGLTSSPEVSGTTIELTGANFASDISVTDNTNGYEFKLTDASGKTFKGSTNGDIITVAGDGVTIDLSGDDVVKVAAGVTSFTVTNFGADDRLVFADTVTDATYADNALSVTVGSNVITINGMPAPTVEDNAWLRATNGNAVFGKSAGNIYTVNGNYINYASQDAETYFELDGLRDDVTTEQLATAITVDGKTITVNSEDILDASKEVELSGAGYSFEAGEAIPKSRYNATGNWTADATDTSKFTYESAGVTSGWIISNNKLRHNINTVKTFTLSGLANTDAENIFVDDKSGTVDINKTAASGEAIQLVDNAGNYQIVLSATSADKNFGGKKFIGTANDDTITINVDNAVVDAGNGFDTLIIGAGVMSLKVENFDATEDKIQFSGAMSGVEMIDGKLVVTSEGGNVSIEGVSGSVDLPTWIHDEADEALKAKLFAGKSAGVYLAEDGMSLINRAEPEVSEEVLAEFDGVTGDPTVTGKTITFAANNFGDGKEISVLDNSGEYAFIVGNEGSSKKFIGTTGKDTITITGSELTLDGKGGGDDIFVTVSRSNKNLYLENFGADDKIQLLDEDGTALTPEITDYSSPNVKSFVAKTTDKGIVDFNGFGAYTGEQSVDWSIDGGNAKLFNATLGGASLNDDGAIVYKAGNVDTSNILFELSGLKNKNGLSLDTSEGLLNLTGNDNFDDEINIVTGGNYKVVLNKNISGKKLIGSDTADNFNNFGASNTIVGGAGNDSIYSCADNVSIDGGAGADVFIYAGGTATITDYNTAEADKISLESGYAVDGNPQIEGDDVTINFADGGKLLVKNAAANGSIDIYSDGEATNYTFSESDPYEFNNTNPTSATAVTVKGASGDFGVQNDDKSETYANLFTITASKQDSTLIGNAKGNDIIVAGGDSNLLVGGLGKDTLTFGNSSSGLIADFGIGATKNGSGKTLAKTTTQTSYDRTDSSSYFADVDSLKIKGKVTGVYFDKATGSNSVSKKDATFSAIVTYDTTGDSIADEVIVLRDVVKKPTTTNSTNASKRVYQTNKVAAATFKIYEGNEGTSAISSTALKGLFREASDFVADCSSLSNIVGALNDKYEAWSQTANGLAEDTILNAGNTINKIKITSSNNNG